MSIGFGISAEKTTEAMTRLIAALDNARQPLADSTCEKFRVKSEEVEIYWFS